MFKLILLFSIKGNQSCFNLVFFLLSLHFLQFCSSTVALFTMFVFPMLCNVQLVLAAVTLYLSQLSYFSFIFSEIILNVSSFSLNFSFNSFNIFWFISFQKNFFGRNRSLQYCQICRMFLLYYDVSSICYCMICLS